jgi:DNA-binding MurR/RpiR family transcriptional regulator
MDIIDKVFLGNIKSLEDTLKIIDRDGVVGLSELCAAASRIVFIGEGSSAIVCDEAALRFSHLDIQAEAYSDTVSILLQASRLKKKQICIGISHSGKTALVGEGLRIAKTRGATTALITNYINTPLKDQCDYILHTSFVENSVKSAAVSSKIAQITIIDTIYLLTAKNKHRIWDLSEFDTMLESIMRVK